LIIEHISHLPIHSGQLGIITICTEGVGTVGSILIALEGHWCFTVVIIGKAKEVVGQQAVVGRAMIVEELDIGLHFTDREGLTIAVTHVDAVETSPHTGLLVLGGATTER
jgi:hypothetical protein